MNDGKEDYERLKAEMANVDAAEWWKRQEGSLTGRVFARMLLEEFRRVSEEFEDYTWEEFVDTVKECVESDLEEQRKRLTETDR